MYDILEYGYKRKDMTWVVDASCHRVLLYAFVLRDMAYRAIIEDRFSLRFLPPLPQTIADEKHPSKIMLCARACVYIYIYIYARARPKTKGRAEEREFLPVDVPFPIDARHRAYNRLEYFV